MDELTLINRRRFIANTTAAFALGMTGGFSSLASAAAPPNSPNSRLRIAVAGTNGRGLAHIQCFAAVKNVEIAYICDVDERAIAKGVAETAKWQKAVPKGIKDFRRALEDPSVDILTIATPDHWHAPMSILALSAGKHVFVEKPCSHNPYEGELLIAAAKKNRRLVQMGNQRRSFPAMQEAIKLIHGGAIGRAYFARGWYTNSRGTIGVGKPMAVPSWLDYDLWQGPAPRRALASNLIHYNWHWFWHWGTGEALNNGSHEIDICRWALGVDHPTKVASIGGRYHFKDDWETPDTQTISWEFAGGKSISWEGRSCNPTPSEGLARGSMIYGTEGSALLDGMAYTFFDPKKKITRQVTDSQPVDPTNTLSSTGMAADILHFKNLADAIRDDVTLTAPIEDANTSVTLMHLGNISQRVGRSLNCDPTNSHILEDAEAMKLWRREYEPGWEPVV